MTTITLIVDLINTPRLSPVLPDRYALIPMRTEDIPKLGAVYLAAYDPGVACETLNEAVADIRASFAGDYGELWMDTSSATMRSWRQSWRFIARRGTMCPSARSSSSSSPIAPTGGAVWRGCCWLRPLEWRTNAALPPWRCGSMPRTMRRGPSMQMPVSRLGRRRGRGFTGGCNRRHVCLHVLHGEAISAARRQEAVREYPLECQTSRCSR